MKSLPLLFLGIFATLAFSWTGIVLVNQVSYGRLNPYFDRDEGVYWPQPLPGNAARGRQVYQELGCVYCHSQQVRHPIFAQETETKGADGKVSTVVTPINPDIDRGWGSRPSVARDYILERRVFLGTMRTGPDLRNIGLRLSADWHHTHLFNPQATSLGSIMPPYRFLYEVRPIRGEPNPRAVKGLRPELGLPAGYEAIPTARADDLVAYLLAQKDVPEDKLPEVRNPGSVQP